jgi:endonuclease YncB( thermonuclease family)
MIGRMGVLLVLLLVPSVGVVSSAPIESDQVRVMDGDTIRIHHQRPDVRLVGFNAPETRRAICETERELGGKATGRLRDLVQSNKLDFEFVACACPVGKEGTPPCNYGRPLAQDQKTMTIVGVPPNPKFEVVMGNGWVIT